MQKLDVGTHRGYAKIGGRNNYKHQNVKRIRGCYMAKVQNTCKQHPLKHVEGFAQSSVSMTFEPAYLGGPEPQACSMVIRNFVRRAWEQCYVFFVPLQKKRCIATSSGFAVLLVNRSTPYIGKTDDNVMMFCHVPGY